MQKKSTTLESNVRSYCRTFPVEFTTARGAELIAADGRIFIDFFAGAGTLNYGHNNPKAKERLLSYIEQDGIMHSLDMATSAKSEFMHVFAETILKPRKLEYKMQFTGPTGTNAVEAALKLARKATRRSNVIAFTGAYHGHTLGALAVTSNEYYHNEFYGAQHNVTRLPYDNFCDGVDSAALLEKMIVEPGSGLTKPAAVILETIQCEGGVNLASREWLQAVSRVCKENDIVLIVDDIQVGNGRTGSFFSFEEAEITPDIVCLSKALGGGLPIALLLLRPDLDVWSPGEHTGTFRGNNLAFVAATALLEYWQDDTFSSQILSKGAYVTERLAQLAQQHTNIVRGYRGRGLIHGLELDCGDSALNALNYAFSKGVVIERAGARGEVLKLIPPLLIPDEQLEAGLNILEAAVEHVCQVKSANLRMLS